ncbi:MAG: hypothetical protein WCD18_08145 [Thermosynechococcaceae cyanobacterium]
MDQTSISQTFGTFLTEVPTSDEYLMLNFSPSSAPRKRRWGNYGLSADFLGDYFSAFFPGDEISDSKINRRETVKAAVSYIANELIENAVKYTDEVTGLPISITLYLYDQEIIFFVTNYSNQKSVEKYQNFIQNFLNSDPDQFYADQLEKTALGHGESSLGILTMSNDYGAKFGWMFQGYELEPNISKVVVMVCLDV